MGVGEEDRPMSHGWNNPHQPPGSPESMSRETAEAILQRHGLDAAGLEANELKRRWQDRPRRPHPDLGGDMQAMQEITAAYAFLNPRGGAAPTRDTASPRVRGLPVW